MSYRIPCGRNTGHGEYCSDGWLCGACETVKALRAELTQIKREFYDAIYPSDFWYFMHEKYGYLSVPVHEREEKPFELVNAQEAG